MLYDDNASSRLFGHLFRRSSSTLIPLLASRLDDIVYSEQDTRCLNGGFVGLDLTNRKAEWVRTFHDFAIVIISGKNGNDEQMRWGWTVP